jgi:predicted TIM-barrel fold metal-dependent hydrolase
VIIDFHVHVLGPVESFVSEHLKLMDEAGVEVTVLQAMPSLEWQGTVLGTNDDVLWAVGQHPERFLGSIYVDPRDDDWRETIERYHGEGFKCIKMWPPVGYYPDEERFRPVFEYIGDLGLPILLHAGTTTIGRTTGSKYGDPIRVEELLRSLPEVRFVLAHWGGLGYLHQAWAIAAHNPNLYLGTAGRNWGWPGIDCYNMLSELYPLDFGRVVWGTDNLGPPAEDLPAWAEILRRIGKDEFADAIFGETARDLLGL